MATAALISDRAHRVLAVVWLSAMPPPIEPDRANGLFGRKRKKHLGFRGSFLGARRVQHGSLQVGADPN